MSRWIAASSPVIHITGQVDAAYVDQDRGFLHAAKDQLGMLDRVGKAAFRAASTDEIPDVLRMAIQLAVAGRPGPVSVEIPIDQQYRRAEVTLPPLDLFTYQTHIPWPSKPVPLVGTHA